MRKNKHFNFTFVKFAINYLLYANKIIDHFLLFFYLIFLLLEIPKIINKNTLFFV